MTEHAPQYVPSASLAPFPRPLLILDYRSSGIERSPRSRAWRWAILSCGFGLAALTLAASLLHWGCGRDARHAAVKTDISGIESALEQYQIDCGVYPTSNDGLAALLCAPPSTANWKGPYLKKFPIDPWGNPYVYQFPGVHKMLGFDISSLGEDGKPGKDDIDNWTLPPAASHR